jgi:hypothetical protein
LARSQLLLFQPLGIPGAGSKASCKEQPSGVASCSAL